MEGELEVSSVYHTMNTIEDKSYDPDSLVDIGKNVKSYFVEMYFHKENRVVALKVLYHALKAVFK